ncbi:breast carcinoma-amplified sequence 4 isoform X2 [Antechinus flavipes]|uniref:breast carcinoma-amplified sequence 4 isoform X2 n=1 Tax=Antechinus flavipes TaxID=38775 RepID=UPI0022369CB1|nr:breast carcinoma-amplified sequence 4 isoform X2 [Antechinus flavipes]
MGDGTAVPTACRWVADPQRLWTLASLVAAVAAALATAAAVAAAAAAAVAAAVAAAAAPRECKRSELGWINGDASLPRLCMHLPCLCQEEPGVAGYRGAVRKSRHSRAFEMNVPEPGPAAAATAAAFMMLMVDGDRDRDGGRVGDREQSESQPEPLHNGAQELALFLTPEPGAEVKEVEANIEDMLLRLEEFCGLTDMIRNDTSKILGENIPLVKAKVMEMNGIYTKVEKLEKQSTPVPQKYELPTLYRTEDYFPMEMPGTKGPTP